MQKDKVSFEACFLAGGDNGGKYGQLDIGHCCISGEPIIGNYRYILGRAANKGDAAKIKSMFKGAVEIFPLFHILRARLTDETEIETFLEPTHEYVIIIRASQQNMGILGLLYDWLAAAQAISPDIIDGAKNGLHLPQPETPLNSRGKKRASARLAPVKGIS